MNDKQQKMAQGLSGLDPDPTTQQVKPGLEPVVVNRVLGRGERPVNAPGIETDADLEALKHALGWDPTQPVPIDHRDLPTEMDHLLMYAFPPDNRSLGNFERQLVSLFADADAWNFTRLAQGFPLHAVAMILWDAGLVKQRTGGSRHGSWIPSYKLVEDSALWTWLKRGDKTWRQKFDGVRFILNSPRTSSQGRQVSLPEVDHGR